MDNTTLSYFIAVTAAAVVLQAFILIAMYLAVRKTSARVESLANDVTSKVLPTAEVAHKMLLEVRPKIETAVANVSETTDLVRAQMERLDATVTDVIDRTRLQVIRTDELVTRTLDRVEETTDMVHRTVVSPVRQVSGLLQGITVGFEALFGKKHRQPSNGATASARDEMFI